jgi:midasin (ATPase involved in ribosome maturation)
MMCLSKLVLQTTKSKHKQKEKITRTRARVNKINTYTSISKEAVVQTNGLVPKRDAFTPIRRFLESFKLGVSQTPLSETE